MQLRHREHYVHVRFDQANRQVLMSRARAYAHARALVPARPSPASQSPYYLLLLHNSRDPDMTQVTVTAFSPSAPLNGDLIELSETTASSARCTGSHTSS